MEYDVVIATRNRPEALALSIPLILRQSRPPRTLIIVDSSDDHDKARETIDQAMGSSQVNCVVLKATPNSSLQRNEGLGQVTAPVVMFPDDDSLWWPDTAEQVLRIYERDVEQSIGGVCNGTALQEPPGSASAPQYRMTIADRVRHKIEHRRHRIEAKYVPDPLWVHGAARWSALTIPPWLLEERAFPVELMSGFRMTFRTNVLREVGGFDPKLGGGIGYAAYEDADACFKVARTHLLVAAHKSQCCHYRFPGARGDAFKIAFFLLFNRAYILAKHAPSGSPARRAFVPFAYYKLVQYAAATHSAFGRQRIAGTAKAMGGGKQLLRAKADELDELYCDLARKLGLSRGVK